MRVDQIGVHQTHCCVLHGCKYCDDDCPVVNRTIKQAYPCEDCHGFMPDPDHPDYAILSVYDSVELMNEILKLRNTIRAHRDGAMDNQALYAVLPEKT